MRKHRLLCLSAAIAAIALVVVLLQGSRPLTFSDILPFPVDRISGCEIVPELTAEVTVLAPDPEETAQLMELLGDLTYQRDGRSSSMQNCYARIYLWQDSRDQYELMLSPESILVNRIRDDRLCPRYRITPDTAALEAWITALAAG